jgi:hypothetical protein
MIGHPTSEVGMADFVNLDALIPREDFIVEEPTAQAAGVEKIDISALDGAFVSPNFRKPDFQRETNQWTPNKVVDLIRSFVDGDLIPAVILWKAGRFIFVIDGAHRLSALLAWIHDDYGDNEKSRNYFGGIICDEQRQAAIRTRDAVKADVGTYSDYKARKTNPESAEAKMQVRLANLAVVHLIGQWVPRTDKQSAEHSFFKINQAATPVDPTEKRILRNRRSASALAARAMSNGGRGHRYWSHFPPHLQKRIEEIGGRIYDALFNPPLKTNAITTLDVPVGGVGYSNLPFAFDLVNQANAIDAEDTETKKLVNDKLIEDATGETTVAYLEKVEKRVKEITLDVSTSLGLHPVVYMYTRGGKFQPSAFLATSRFAGWLKGGWAKQQRSASKVH